MTWTETRDGRCDQIQTHARILRCSETESGGSSGGHILLGVAAIFLLVPIVLLTAACNDHHC